MDKTGAQTIVRGLRAVSDFEYEFQMALMNRRLNDRVDTVFLVPKEEYIYCRAGWSRRCTSSVGTSGPGAVAGARAVAAGSRAAAAAKPRA